MLRMWPFISTRPQPQDGVFATVTNSGQIGTVWRSEAQRQRKDLQIYGGQATIHDVILFTTPVQVFAGCVRVSEHAKIHIYVGMCIYIYVCVYIRKYIYTQMYICMYVCMYVNIDRFDMNTIHRYMHMYVFMYIYDFTHMCDTKQYVHTQVY